MQNGAHFLNLPDILLGQRGSFCNLGYDLLIVVGDPQLFLDSAAKLAAAAAEFTANGDDPFHIVLLSGKSLSGGVITAAYKGEWKQDESAAECTLS